MPRKTEMPEDYKSRYLARTRYEQAVVKNLKPMLGPYGDNETASLFLNGAVEKRTKLFGDDVSRNAPTASELLTRAMNYAPSAPEPKPAKKEPGVIDRVKEATSVARDLAGIVVGGYADASTLSKKNVSDFGVAMTAASLVRNMERNGVDSSGVEVRANGQITNVKSGRTRDISESDRRDINEFKKEIELQQASKGGNARGESKALEVRKETYDTPIPDNLRPAYDAWYGQLPKNLQYTGDYDLQGAWLERLGQPTKYEATQNGHLDDYGKKPNHPTFSSGSKWHDPKIPERTGGEWKKAADGSWDFYPGSGNVLTDEQLKDYFNKYEKGSRVHPRNVQQAAKAGDAGKSTSSGVPSGHNPALDGYSGPRIVINPSTFKNEKDGLCVAFDEAFRILMEVNGFDPVAEPTEKQREFFADTAYADDENMMRRTILARICTFDTSVTDPTDEQLQEAVEFLDTVLEIGAPQNNFEQRAVERIRTAIASAMESGERVPVEQAPVSIRTSPSAQPRVPSAP